jgi:hypothetical protein
MRHRYRFSRVAEDVGEESVLTVRTRGPWWCFCGEINEHDDSHCRWCKNERGDWQCDCGRLNRRADKECSDCGTPKPDDE